MCQNFLSVMRPFLKKLNIKVNLVFCLTVMEWALSGPELLSEHISHYSDTSPLIRGEFHDYFWHLSLVFPGSVSANNSSDTTVPIMKLFISGLPFLQCTQYFNIQNLITSTILNLTNKLPPYLSNFMSSVCLSLSLSFILILLPLK